MWIDGGEHGHGCKKTNTIHNQDQYLVATGNKKEKCKKDKSERKKKEKVNRENSSNLLNRRNSGHQMKLSTEVQ